MPFPAFARRLILLAAAAIYLLTDTVSSDTWWALRAGKDMWRTHHVLLTETYSYTAFGAHWPNHEWLWQVVAYALYVVGGLALLSAVNLVLAVGALALARPPGPVTRADAYLLLPAAALLRTSMEIRPQVATLFLVSLTVWLLVRNRPWLTVPVILLWANMHGGVLLGVVALGSAFAAALVHGLIAARTGNANWRPTLSSAGALALGVAATLATPLGVGLWTYVAGSVARSKRDHVGEWQSAFHLDATTVTFWLVVLAVSGIVWWRRHLLADRRATFLLIVTVAYAVEGAAAVRNIPVFALTATPLAVLLLRPAIEQKGADSAPFGRSLVAIACAVLAAVGTAMAIRPPAAQGWNPIRAGAVAAIEECPGRTYTAYNSSGVLIWLVPRVPVFVDNRQDPYPDGILTLGLLGSATRSTDYAATFRRFDVRCAAFMHGEDVVRSFLIARGWHSGYDDGSWIVMTAPGTRLMSHP